MDTRKDIGSVTKGYPGFTPVNGFRVDAYSADSFELFWDRNNDVQNVHIDGRLVTRTEGTRYFYTDENLDGTVQVAVVKAWPTSDNGYDSLLNVADIELPLSTGTSGDGYTDGTEGGSKIGTITVQDGSIELANDGWYQLQRASDYSTVCQGGLSCDVDSGSYTLINHTTGERFDIEVTESHQKLFLF